MKIFKYIYLFAAIVPFFSSCEKDADLDTPTFEFSIQKVDSLEAGKQVIFDFKNGSADNITIFTGDPGHDYSVYPANKGAAVTAPYSRYYYNYPQGGQFTVTVVAENRGKDGTVEKKVVKTLVVNVAEKRAAYFKTFVLKKASTSYTGTIDTTAKTITVKVDPGTDVTKLLPVITKSVDSTKVTYGDNNKVFVKTDSVDFSSPVKFTISSISKTSTYLVTVSFRSKYSVAYWTASSSSNKKVTVGKPDTAARTVTVKYPWGVILSADSLSTKIKATTLSNAVVTVGSTILNGNNTTYFPVNKKDTALVSSENGSVVKKYALKVTQDSAITSFTLNDSVSSLSPAPVGVINHTAKTIVVTVIKGTSLTKGYIATFKGTDYAKVKIGDVTQVSGTTKNQYNTSSSVATPQSLTITSETGRSVTYTVTLVSL